MFTTVKISLPTWGQWPDPAPAPAPEGQGSSAASTHSTRLYEEYTPPVSCLSDRKTINAYTFHGESAVDIIAVHGLAGARRTSWSVEEKDGERYHWLREKLPKDLPVARILTFEYDSEWYKNPSHVDLRECAEQLLRCIIQDRRHQGDLLPCPVRRKRPIIFIGHSFGGLVIKQALLSANQLQISSKTATSIDISDFRNHQDIIACTAGIIFLGTPHNGSNFHRIAKAKMVVGSWLGYSNNPDLVDLLELNGSLLKDLRHQFNHLRKAEIMANLQLYCYFEQENMPPLPMEVVTESSACIDGAKRRGLPLNHKQLNKFKRGEDKNYNTVLADILEIVKACAEIVPPRFEAWQYNASRCNSLRERLRRSLNPSRDPQKTQLKSRLAVQKASSYTCQWIFKLPAFEAWSDWSAPQNVLWINGKAGSGKSVMAAFLVNSFRQGVVDFQDEDETTVCSVPLASSPCGYKRSTLTVLHFFCGIDRTHEEPCSFIGTLLHQLLSQHSENQRLMDMAQKVYRHKTEVEISVMIKLLVDLINLVGKVIIIVDGLEEALHVLADKREVYKHFIKRLAFANGRRNVRLLFFSQGIEDIHQELINTFSFPAIISITDHSQADIAKFVEVEVADLIKKKPKLSPKEQAIVQTLKTGAQGMFQWVGASIVHLNNDINVPEDVDRCLEDLPQGLTSTYDRMFLRISKMPPMMQLRVKIALRWLAVQARPLTALELKVAIMMEDDPDKGIKFIMDSKYDYAAIVQELRRLLEDLIQIDQLEDSTYTVQLAHPSLRKALTSEIFLDNQSITPYKFTDEIGHSGCAFTCIKLVQQSALSNANAFGISQAPLVEYAWEFWSYHFKKSKASLKDEAFQGAFDDMMLDVTRDTMAFLGALTEFVSRPLDHVPGVDGDLAYIVSLQYAQESILPSMSALETVLGKAPHSAELVKAKELVSRSKYTADATTKVQEVSSWVERRVAKFRVDFLRTESAVLNLRADEYIASNVHLRPTVLPPMYALWDAAKKLRIVALRFAVNPVYGALIEKAGGATFSPIHFLVHVASLLEECGNYPYWEHLPPTFDVMEPFICKPQDPFSGAARFVLHSFEYRYPAAEEAKAGQDAVQLSSPKRRAGHRRTRSHSPRPDPRDVGAYQTISANDRRRIQALQEMPGDKFLTASFAYNLFHIDDDSPLRLVVNPLKNAHMDKFLLLEEEQTRPLRLEDPNRRLVRHAPQSIQTSPLTQYLRALPAMLRLEFVRYFALVAEVFGHFSEYALATHFARWEAAKEELMGAKIYFKRLLDVEDPAKLWHLVPAIALFWLRSIFFPTFGHHHLPHPWKEFIFSYRHPAAYLDWQDQMSFWRWGKWALNYFVAKLMTVHALTFGLTLPPGPLRDAHNILAGFSIICQLERSVFTMSFVVATLIASARIILIDEESTMSVLNFSFLYWVNTFAGICISCFQMGMLTHVSSFWHLFALCLTQLFLSIAWICYSHVLFRFVAYCFKRTLYTATWPLWLIMRAFMRHHTAIFKSIGIFLFVYGGFLALYWMSRWVRDPYDTASSLAGLVEARRIMRSAVPASQRKRIGCYPLGSTVEALANDPDGITSHPEGFRLSVRAPTLELEMERKEQTLKEQDAGAYQQNPQQERVGDPPPEPSPNIIPEITADEIFEVFFGAESVPKSARTRGRSPNKKPQSAIRDDGVSVSANVGDGPQTAAAGVSGNPNTKLQSAIWDDGLSPEEVYNKYFEHGTIKSHMAQELFEKFSKKRPISPDGGDGPQADAPGVSEKPRRHSDSAMEHLKKE